MLAQFEEEKSANDFINKAFAKYNSIGIQTTCLVKELPYSQNKSFYESVLSPLFTEMQIRKNQPENSETKVSTILATPCEGIGLEVAEFVIKTPEGDFKRVSRSEAYRISNKTFVATSINTNQSPLRQWLDKYDTPHDFGDLVTWGTKSSLSDKTAGTSEDRMMAVLYADINSLGSMIKKIGNNREQYIKFSKDINDAINNSLYEALNNVITPDYNNRLNKNIPTRCLPLNVLYVGGDDLALAVKAKYAFNIALELVKYFEHCTSTVMASFKTYSSELPDHLTISIGIVFCPFDYPIKWVNSIGKSLLSRTKSLSKKNGVYPPNSLIDFCTIKNNTFGSLSDIRRHMIIKDGIASGYDLLLFGGPYSTETLISLIDCVNLLSPSGKTKLSIPMSKLKALLSIMSMPEPKRNSEFKDWLSGLSKDQLDIYDKLMKKLKINRDDKQPISRNIKGEHVSLIGDLDEMLRILKS